MSDFKTIYEKLAFLINTNAVRGHAFLRTGFAMGLKIAQKETTKRHQLVVHKVIDCIK